MDSNAILLMKKALTDWRVIDLEHDTNAVLERQKGKVFSFQDHLKGLVYSLLTNQREWSTVEPKLPQIDELFFYYDVNKIKEHDGQYFEDGIRKLKCGNRSIKMQMEGLHYNINILEKIARTYGSLDAYVTSKSPDTIVSEISSGKYKLKGIGVALAWEYLRNVGIDGAKPDTHLKRFMGSERMGVSRHPEASDDEVIREVKSLANVTGLTPFEIDYIIWCYCANGKGEVCTANPNCSRCVIREYCRKGYGSKQTNKREYEYYNKNERVKSERTKTERKKAERASYNTYNPDEYFVNKRRNEKLQKEDMSVNNGEVYISKTIKLVNNEFDLGGKCSRAGAMWFRWFVLLMGIVIILGGLLVTIAVPPAGIIFVVFGILSIRYSILLKKALDLQLKTRKDRQ